jgi:hypothetical protein
MTVNYSTKPLALLVYCTSYNQIVNFPLMQKAGKLPTMEMFVRFELSFSDRVRVLLFCVASLIGVVLYGVGAKTTKVTEVRSVDTVSWIFFLFLVFSGVMIMYLIFENLHVLCIRVADAAGDLRTVGSTQTKTIRERGMLESSSNCAEERQMSNLAGLRRSAKLTLGDDRQLSKKGPGRRLGGAPSKGKPEGDAGRGMFEGVVDEGSGGRVVDFDPGLF